MRDDRDDRHDADRDDRRDPEELDERVADLEARVRELRDELGRPPEGPLGLPRPPTPREVLSFTGEYAIPTAIAMLEANIRALEALQRVVQVLDPDRSAVGGERDRLESRAADASRATLDRLESALEDVEAVVRESDLPRESEARDILEDARRINREIRDRMDRERRNADETRERGRERPDRERTDHERPEDDLDGGTTIELTDESEDTDDTDERTDGRGEVDVEAELRSIKDEIEERKDADRLARTEPSEQDGDEEDQQEGEEAGDSGEAAEDDGEAAGDDDAEDA